ncbi:MAG: hypothetical protein WKF60_07825 [Ilumatobacter sp.]
MPDAPTPFVLGGSLRRPTWSGSRLSILSLAAVLVVVMAPVRGLYRATGSSMEEGFMIVFPRLVQQGALPNRDFLHLYGPTSLDGLALWFRIVGDTLESQRTFGLLQHLGIILGLYALTRAWGHVAAVGAAWVATMLIVTPIGLSALAWHGALAFGVWAIVFAVRSLTTHSLTDLWWAGGLAGLALGYRPDLVVALSLAFGFVVWRRRDGWAALVGGAVVGLLPMWYHLVRVGPTVAIRGMLLDPLFELRPGRELPRPPGWSEADGALQAVAEGSPPWWGLPAIGHPQQLFFWFFAVILIAVAIPVIGVVELRRAEHDDDRRRSVALIAAGLFGFGVIPQALQRPDSTHLAWVAVISWSLLVPAIMMRLRGLLAVTWRAIAATVVVGLLMLVVCPFYTYRHYLLHTRVSAQQLPLPFLVERGPDRFWFGDFFVAKALNEMIPDLEARSQPGDRLIVGPADLSRTIYSDVSVYFLFPELVPATYFIEMDPGLADAEGSGLAEDIASADFLVLTNIWTGWNEPNASDRHLSQEGNQAVADGFCLVGRYEDNLVLLYERCEGGGGVSPADVTGRYPTVENTDAAP